ncbi:MULTISPECIES: tryptophan halogenase family protein [Asticcacaulis]|uniref:tryptophan halogenase family protein n=1 Tax=Asticcacaulis TaxID=76890 RepID=UPI001AE9CC2E|nr:MULTISPECIES: tryptophan halogenase family protein [Asticcacaulis]MBP2160513.1 tryptophan halogenase [Asticcacaulis solisilvae]MDR6801558.1 tryptophan halogenase [Asticcacaulis sp. BE141]
MQGIQTVLIVGGGTAGWMTAASLAKNFAGRLGITVIESSQVGTVGVGEATVPAIRDYIASLQVDIREVMRATSATVKLGIAFEGWHKKGEAFFHPFGLYGVSPRDLEFHHIWHRLNSLGETAPLSAYSLCTQMALQGRFAPSSTAPSNDLEIFDWALHFDASRFAAWLSEYAQARGVRHIDAKIATASASPDGQLVANVTLDDGRTMAADLFIDCSGFRSLLLGQTLGVGYEDWSEWLFCDRAVALPCEHGGDWAPYTRSVAEDSGWRWRIPLQHRVGNGYVYSSRHISAEDAEARLRESLEGEVLADANHLSFTPGRRQQTWKGNCVAVGLAAGFLEPLESTGIVLIQTAIEKLLKLFPTESFCEDATKEFNRTTRLEYERIRDFIILHYCRTRRDDTAFWRDCSNVAIPDELRHRIALFETKGYLVRHEWDTFRDPSWLSLFSGMGVTARDRNAAADTLNADDLVIIAGRMRDDVMRLALRTPKHKDFIDRL